jgi:invasion protein IalB
MYKYIILSVVLLGISFSANAQQFISEHGNWAVFTSAEAGSKVCYITANPTRKTGNYRVRGDVYMIVTYRGGNSVPEVAIDTGYEYKRNSEVGFSVDGRRNFKLFTSAQTPQMAWAKDAQTDRTIIDALKRGGNLSVRGTSIRGTTSQDTYSLRGFTAAYNKMMSSCR